MRNLKKVLSLTLALVMMLGMMTFAGAAETKIAFDDFKDKADITKVDAVRLMVDLGILVGDANGNFSPKGEIDRASMAKLVYTAKMGTADASALAGAGVFTDVAAKHWASGYVNYCASTKIIAGTTDVTFAPSAKVTTAAAAKMLLVALGYDAAHQGYVGNSWAVNSMRDANKLGMLDGVDQTANQNLTRENAAQMLYNALNTLTVFNKLGYKFDGTSYVTETVANTTTLGYEAYHMIKVEALVDKIEDGKAFVTATTAGTIKDYDSMLPATADMAGNKVTFFVEGKVNAAGVITETGKLISTALMATPFTLLGSSADGTKVVVSPFTSGTSKDLTTRDSKNKTFIAELEPDGADEGDSNPDVKYYVNGVASGTYATDLSAANTAAVKVGAVVELFDANGNGKADIIRVTDKTVATISGEVKTKTATDGTVTVLVPGVTAGYESVKAYDGMKKSDVVLYVKIGGVYFIELAKTVEGKVTGKNSDNEIKVDGTYYGVSGLQGTNFDNGAFDDYKNTYTFYLDNSKNIVKAKQLTEESTGKVAYVMATKWVAGGSMKDSSYAEAKILLQDGTVEYVKVATIDGKTIIAPNDTQTLNADEINFSWKESEAAKSAIAKANKDSFYSFTVDKNGKYELKTIIGTKDYDSANIASATITGGKAMFDKATGGHVANSKTVFIVNTAKDTYKVYTGIANLPDMKANTDTANSHMLLDNGIATFVFLNTSGVGGVISGTVGEYVFVPGKLDASVKFEIIPGTDALGEHQLVNAVVDGKLTTIMVDHVSDLVGDNASALKAGVLYAVDAKNADGIVTKVTAVVDGTPSGVVVKDGMKITSDTMAIGGKSAVYYTLDSATEIYVLDADGVTKTDYTALTSDATDKVVVVKATTKNVAEIVYIVKVSSDATTFTGIKYKIDAATAVDGTITSGVVTTAATDDATKTITITDVTGLAAGASWAVSGTCKVLDNAGEVKPANQITITITAEDGTAVETVVTFKDKA